MFGKTVTFLPTAIALAIVSVTTVGCVPYKTHEAVKFEYDRLLKSYEDLTGKYNRMLREGGGNEDTEALRQQLASSELTIAELQSKLNSQTLAFDEEDLPEAEIGPDGELILNHDLLFASGSADLKSSGQRVLDDFASILKSKYSGETFHVLGHTDNVPVAKTKQVNKNNLNLGYRRAYVVFDYLNRRHAMSERQFYITTFGETNPKADNGTKQGKALNRRVEIRRRGFKL